MVMRLFSPNNIYLDIDVLFLKVDRQGCSLAGSGYINSLSRLKWMSSDLQEHGTWEIDLKCESFICLFAKVTLRCLHQMAAISAIMSS